MKIYTLKTCDSCRKSTRWLRENGFTFQEIPIREQPPTLPEIHLALNTAGGNIRKLFNTSGQDYRALKLKEALDTMPSSEALSLIASNGNLIKRPFLVSDHFAIAGFDETKWGSVLS
jgi:arsenate reductase (glutaredoxin)